MTSTVRQGYIETMIGKERELERESDQQFIYTYIHVRDTKHKLYIKTQDTHLRQKKQYTARTGH